jgi:serine/threonine protein kinase
VPRKSSKVQPKRIHRWTEQHFDADQKYLCYSYWQRTYIVFFQHGQAYRDLVMELDVLTSVGKHQNLVEFYGACVQDPTNPVILEEFVEGPNLENFLEVTIHEYSRFSLHSHVFELEFLQNIFCALLIPNSNNISEIKRKIKNIVYLVMLDRFWKLNQQNLIEWSWIETEETAGIQPGSNHNIQVLQGFVLPLRTNEEYGLQR